MAVSLYICVATSFADVPAEAAARIAGLANVPVGLELTSSNFPPISSTVITILKSPIPGNGNRRVENAVKSPSPSRESTNESNYEPKTQKRGYDHRDFFDGEKLTTPLVP